ncbi:transporter substrate-binding domain-containing protein [Bacillus massilinigeriensis]|uniref:transporter substrate-binding domain-containing protein n=1 Tax=Bacillus massilionigeriensis TaxID=1805475 RepID=UPI00096AE780|nr:transporter substrate-binding domain-containing protein [Bacillus massilionigeriensis]
MKKAVSIMFMSIFLVGILAACGANDKSSEKNGKDSKVIVMGTSADYQPFEYVDTAKSDEIIGLDVDIAKTIGEKLGYTVQVRDMDFNGLIPSIEAKQVDFVLAGMTPTEERKKNVDFSDVYYQAKHMIVTKKDSKVKTLVDLKGKTVGVQLASVQEEEANNIKKDINIKIENRNRIPELIQEIKAGRFEAAIIEDTVAKEYFKKNKDLDGFTIEGNAEDAGYAIAFPKDSKLTNDFNQALIEMKENGEIDKLIVKWFNK